LIFFFQVTLVYHDEKVLILRALHQVKSSQWNVGDVRALKKSVQVIGANNISFCTPPCNVNVSKGSWFKGLSKGVVRCSIYLRRDR
jgi:hypothetical protein